jgi:hypothetical protein
MGHSRLGTLPDTAPWRKLIGLITGGATVPVVASATAQAAQHGLELADGDAGLCHAFYLLSQLTLAARQENFAAALRDLGLSVPSDPSVLSIVGGFTDAIDKHLRQSKSRTDVGEMAQMAAAESLTSVLSERARSLFGTTAAEVKRAVNSCGTQAGFSDLAHDFFARFTQRYLVYHLSRELANHVGHGQRFNSPAEHTAFVDQLKVHCREAALIVRDFAGRWHSKANFEGGISPAKARGFVHVALNKLRRELTIRGKRDVG